MVSYVSPTNGPTGTQEAGRGARLVNGAKTKRPNPLKRVENHVQGRTLSGLVELVPLLVTIVVILFLVANADGLIRPLVSGRPWDFPGVGLVALIVIFYLTGVLITTRLGRRIVDFMGTVLSLIPLVKTVFGVAQQVTTALTSQYNFSRVVFLEWPREGMAAMGFVTSRVHSPDSGESLVLVYIPTIPNPTSGNMALVPEDDVMETDLSVEDAMKLVFSGGIVLPDTVSLARVPRVEVDHPGFVGRFQSDPTGPDDS